jgi:plastocyanin domain-containing protein
MRGRGWLFSLQKRKQVVLFRCGLLVTACLTVLTGGVLLISGCTSKPVAAVEGSDGIQTVKVLVKHGYFPSHIEAKAGKPLKVEFYRDEERGTESCGQDLMIPEESVNIPLPARESQIVEIKPHAPGEMLFQCGMNMMKGKITFK